MFSDYNRIKLKSIKKIPENFPDNLKLNKTFTNNPLVSEEIKKKFIKHSELKVMKMQHIEICGIQLKQGLGANFYL